MIRHYNATAIDCDGIRKHSNGNEFECDISFYDSIEWQDQNLIKAALRAGWKQFGDTGDEFLCPTCVRNNAPIKQPERAGV